MSVVSYGNWLIHGSQVDADQATACLHAALDVGITTYDTADVYADGRAETILGTVLSKVFFPTGPRGPNDRSLSRKHIAESINASLRRLQTDYVDLYQAHRFDIRKLLTPETLMRVQRLAPLAMAEGLTMAQMAIAWVLQNDNVASAITGGSRPEQIEANARAAGHRLSYETLAGIDGALLGPAPWDPAVADSPQQMAS